MGIRDRMSIILTGVLGNMACELILRLARVSHPVAKGLALGTSAHAVGTAKALEMGEIEGAMSKMCIRDSCKSSPGAANMAPSWS